MDKDDIILSELRALREELQSYTKLTIENQMDIRWMKGSAKVVTTVIAAVVSGAVSFLLHLLNK